MENLWIFYALSGLLALGIADFIKKLVVKKGGNKEVFLFMWFASFILILGGNFILNSDTDITKVEIRSALIIGLCDFLAPLGILTALKYLDSSFSFVSIRLISSIFIFIIGTQILGDSLNYLNVFGFILGAFAIYLMSGYTFSQKTKLNKKGFLAVLVAIIGIVGGHSYLKYSIAQVSIDNLMFLKFSVGFLFLILYMTVRRKFKYFTMEQLKITSGLAFLTSIIFSLYLLYFLPQIYLLGPLSLGYKILSYSLIVPIILSIILYKEKITKRKLIAFVLTIVSLGLFII